MTGLEGRDNSHYTTTASEHLGKTRLYKVYPITTFKNVRRYLKAMPNTTKLAKKKLETILVIVAHPDDEILGPGGTIAKYAQEGKKIISIIFSYGEGGNWWLKQKYTQDLRTKESKRAAAIVGCSDTIFLGLKDMSLKQEIEKPEVLDQLEEHIKTLQPSRIFTHSFDDVVYPDHKAVHDSVITVLQRMNYKGDVYTFNIWGKDVRATAHPKLVVDIRDTFKYKIKALKEFKSQRFLVMWQLLPIVYARALKAGFEHKCRFAEKFVHISLKDEPK